MPFSFVQNGYGCGQNPTLDLIEAFEYKDGSDGTLKLKDASGNYIKYDSPLDLFKDKDPRLRATFYLPMDECREGSSRFVGVFTMPLNLGMPVLSPAIT